MHYLKTRIHIIGGAGKVARGLISALRVNGIAAATPITISGPHLPRLQAVAHEYGNIKFSTDNKRFIRQAEVIVLAVKPKQVCRVCEEIAGLLTARQIVISCAAVQSLVDIERWLKHDRIGRAMPNLALIVRESCTAWLPGKKLSKRQRQLAVRMLECFGSLVIVEGEEAVDNHTITSATGLALIAKCFAGLEQAAIYLGESRHNAQTVVLQTAMGVIALMKNNKYKTFDELIHAVMTPGAPPLGHCIHWRAVELPRRLLPA